MTLQKVIDQKGSIKYFLDGKLHRDDGPALEHQHYHTYYRAWYQHGLHHREGGPAVEKSTSINKWIKLWYRNGRLHREDGPAIEKSNGTKMWYLNGYQHRTDGPALKSKSEEGWFFQGKRISVNSQKQFEAFLKKRKKAIQVWLQINDLHSSLDLIVGDVDESTSTVSFHRKFNELKGLVEKYRSLAEEAKERINK